MLEFPAITRADGACIECGQPIAWHRDGQNRTLSCAQVAQRIAQPLPVKPAQPLDTTGWDLVGVAESSTGQGAYELRRDPKDGTVSCSCKGFMFRSACKHVRQWLEAQRA